MFDIIPGGERKYDVIKLAAHLKCGFLDREILYFIALWNRAVHCSWFYDYRLNAWGQTCGIDYFDTETSATSLIEKGGSYDL